MATEEMTDKNFIIGFTASVVIHLMLFVILLSFSPEKISGVKSKEIRLSFYQPVESKRITSKAAKVIERKIQKKRKGPATKKVVKENAELNVPPVDKRASKKEKKEFSQKIANPVKEIETIKEIENKEIETRNDKVDNRMRDHMPEAAEKDSKEKVSEDKVSDNKTDSPVIEHAAAPLLENDTARIYRGAFGKANGPRFLKKVLPRYPRMARRLGREGVVVLKLFIDSKGNLKRVEVLKDGGYGFGKAALEAVKSSTFVPAMRDGKPVDSEAILTVRFKLRDS